MSWEATRVEVMFRSATSVAMGDRDGGGGGGGGCSVGV